MHATTEDDDEDAAPVVSTFYHLHIFKQLPYLIKACELWLHNSDQANLIIFEASAGEIGLGAAAVVSYWWTIITSLARVIDPEHIGEHERHINTVRDNDTFDLLDDEFVGWYSTKYKKYSNSGPLTKTIKLVESKSDPTDMVTGSEEAAEGKDGLVLGSKEAAEGKDGLVLRIPMKRKVSNSETPPIAIKNSKNTPVITIYNNQLVKPKPREAAAPVDKIVYSTVDNMVTHSLTHSPSH